VCGRKAIILFFFLLERNCLMVFGMFQLHIDAHAEPTSPKETQDMDFFSEHTKDEPQMDLMADQKLFAPQPVKNGTTQGNL
jgi:hypothetical protein